MEVDKKKSHKIIDPKIKNKEDINPSTAIAWAWEEVEDKDNLNSKEKETANIALLEIVLDIL